MRLHGRSAAFVIFTPLVALAAWGALALSERGAGAVPPLNPLSHALAGRACRIFEDAQGIPHARPERSKGLAEADVAAACMGYLHGRDRGWEMDFFRRTAQGRRAEVLGTPGIKVDFTMRLLGLDERAQAIFAKMDRESQDRLWAYAHGATLGLREADRMGQYEFRRFGYHPEPWNPVNTIEVLLLESFDQSRKAYQKQLEEDARLDELGREAAASFIEDGLPWDVSILKEGEFPRAAKAKLDRSSIRAPKAAKVGDQARNGFAREALALFPSLGPELGPGVGSNNWVLAPGRSRSGNAWVANDPHLPLRHPPFWYWLNLTTSESDVIGASLPGTLETVSGANRDVAWGLTNSYFETMRLALVPATDVEREPRHWPLIWVRVWKFQLPFFFKSFRRTRLDWPVLPLPAPEGRSLVLRWTGFEVVADDFAALRDLPFVRTAGGADQVLARVGIPTWNFVFADVHGRIGYRAEGRLARIPAAPPLGVRSERLSELEADPAYERPLTPDEAPHVLDPRRGFIATANNRQWPVEAGLHGGRAYAAGFRALRIEELLRATPKHDLDSISRVQCDVQAVDARFLLPPLLEAMGRPLEGRAKGEKVKEEAARPVLDALAAWSRDGYRMSLDCRACAPYRRWVDRVLSEGDLNEAALYRRLQPGPGKDGEPASVETVALVRQAFGMALRDLELDRVGAELRPWGELHGAPFRHLSEDRALSARDRLPTPGDDFTVNPGTSDFREDGKFDHGVGASERLVVELSLPPKVYSVLAGSETDVDDRKLDEAGSPWRQWRDCELLRREFPLDWKANPGTLLEL